MAEPFRKRILFIVEGATLAHIARPFVLARALDPARYEVHFACPDGYDFVWKDAPFQRWPLYCIPSEQFQKALATGNRVFDYSTLERYIADDRRLMDEVRPDLVVGDFRLSLAVSAPLSKVRHVAIGNAYWSPYAKSDFHIPEHPMNRILGVTMADKVFRAVRTVIFSFHAQLVNRLRTHHGLSSLGDMLQVYTHGDFTVFGDTPVLVPTYDLPANHYYLGPILWSPSAPAPEWWDRMPLDRPSIYVTLGSSGRANLLPLIVQALSDMDVNVMVATAGQKTLPEKLPENVWAAPYLSGTEAARRSRVVISNGGSATSYQALAEGVPVLGICSNLDQYLSMGYVEKAEAGRHLRSGTATLELIRESVKSLLLEARYRKGARAVASEFSQWRSGERFQALVDAWLSSR